MKINKHILKNGLRLLHYLDANTQMVAVNIMYNVGSKDEHPDHTGFAHLFEHLMFAGSANVPDFDELVQRASGENNAWTNTDVTNYYISLPAHNLEMALYLERNSTPQSLRSHGTVSLLRTGTRISLKALWMSASMNS